MRSVLSRMFPPLLREAEFRRFWLGQTISLFGDQITLLAVPVLAALTLRADPAQMGLLTAVGLLPHLLFSLPAGVWLDRVQQRRRLMIMADVGRAITIAIVPLLFVLNLLTIESLFVVAFIVGTFAVVFDISWNTIFVSVAKRDQYVEASALLNGSRSVSSFAGPAVAGLLIEVLKAPLALLADAFSFLGSAFFLGRIRAEEPPIEHQPGTLREQLSSGLGFIFRDPIIRTILLSAGTLNFFNYCFAGLFILYVTVELGIEPGILGLALGAGAIGGILGAIIASRVGRAIGLGRAYLLGLIVFPGSLLLVPLAGGQPEPIVLAFIFLAEFGSGLGVMILDINVGAMMLARTPDRIRARSTGAFRFINMGIRPVGATLGGLLGATFGVQTTLYVVVIAQLAGALWLIGSQVLGIRDMPEEAE